jgi:hypothetical protein
MICLKDRHGELPHYQKQNPHQGLSNWDDPGCRRDGNAILATKNQIDLKKRWLLPTHADEMLEVLIPIERL